VYDEAAIVTERNTTVLGLQAVLAQYAHLAVVSKKGGPAFKKVLENMEAVTEPVKDLLSRNT
jgi:hypothetical protein